MILIWNRIPRMACLFAGRVLMNDTDDNDDREGTIVWLSVILYCLGLVKLIPFRL